MTKRNGRSIPAFGFVFQALAIPGSFFVGFLTGLAAPLAAIAAMVTGVRLLTGRVPFLGHIWEDEDGARHLSFKLVAPEQVRDLFDEQKEQIGGDVAKLRAEIEAIVKESRAKAAPEQDDEG
jgi:hypothetical protein